MEERQARVMVLLALLLVAVVAAVVYWEPEEEESDTAATVAMLALDDLDSVQGLRVERASDTLVLDRVDDVWMLRSPMEDSGNPDAVHEVLDALRDMGKGIPIDGGDPEVFGLGEPPRVRVLLTFEDGSQRSYDVGKETPVGYRTYARGPNGGVVAVSGDLGRPMLKPVNQFRNPRLLHFDPKDVQRASIVSKQGALGVHRDALGWWSEGFTRADPDRVDDLLVGLLDLRFDSFLDGAVDGPIRDPRYLVTVQTQDATHTLRIGDDTAMGTLAQLDDGTTGVVFKQALALLGQGPSDIGDPAAFPLDPERATEVSVVLPSGSVTLVHDPEGPWKRDDAVDQRVIPALDDAKIHYTLRPVPPLERWAEVRVTYADREQVVLLGQQVGPDRVAQDQDGGEPYLVPEVDLQRVIDAISAG